MSNKSNDNAPLWSKIGSKVKTPPAQTPQRSTQPAVATTAKKGALVLKPTVASDTGNYRPGGFLPFAGQKSWADYDDDDEYVLQPSVDARAKRIEELKDDVANNAARVNELEKEVQTKTARINDLEGVLEEQVALIAELNDANNAQEYNLRQYIGEVDEKDRRIAYLEAEIEEQAVHIRELEPEAEDELGEPVFLDPLSPATAVEYPASDDAASEYIPSERAASETEFAKQAATEDAIIIQVGPEDTATEENATGVADEKDAIKHAAEATNDTHEIKLVELSPEEYPALAATSPAHVTDDSKAASTTPAPAPRSPVFATPQTIKKAPPVPPAPVLKMGIDMSNWGKKPVAKSTFPSHSKGYIPRRLINSTAVPTINTSRDIRKMTRFEREPLGNGGDVEIQMGKQALGKVPKYMLMQCSYIANKHLTENPKSTLISFPKDSMDVEAAKVHLDWMRQHCVAAKVFSIALDPEHGDVRNMNIVRAARVLGLNNTYIGHFTKQYCDKIRRDDLTWELMELIAALVFLDNDPIFECLANNIANQRRIGNVVDPEALQAFLQKYPILAARVYEIERQHTSARKVQSTRR